MRTLPTFYEAPFSFVRVGSTTSLTTWQASKGGWAVIDVDKLLHAELYTLDASLIRRTSLVISAHDPQRLDAAIVAGTNFCDVRSSSIVNRSSSERRTNTLLRLCHSRSSFVSSNVSSSTRVSSISGELDNHPHRRHGMNEQQRAVSVHLLPLLLVDSDADRLREQF